MRICITGATGLVGKALLKQLSTNRDVIGLTRGALPSNDSHLYTHCDYHDHESIVHGLQGCHTLVHLIAKTHAHQTSLSMIDQYREVNVDLTRRLLNACKQQSVKHVIFLSSIKVNGEGKETAYRASDTPSPLDAYGTTKLEAEKALIEFCSTNHINYTIIRPTIIYSPSELKGNFKSLANAIRKRHPLPLASIKNTRSITSLENLVDLIELCIQSENSKNQIFLVSDNRRFSTPELVKKIAEDIHGKPLLFPFPQSIFRYSLLLIGKENIYRKLCGSLSVDISETKKQMGWEPKS